MPKNKMTKQQRHDHRIRNAKQWLTTYTGTPKKITKHYRERFHLDINTAVSDLQEIGVVFTQEYLDAVKKSEEERIKQKHKKKAEKKQAELDNLYEDSDDIFAYIAGYTPGGAPYGTTWEELGLEPYASAEEIEAAYDNLSRNGIEDNELLFEEFFGEDDYFCVTDRILMREMNENDFDDYLLVMKDLTPKVMQTGDMKQYFMKGARESFQSIDTEDTLLIGIWERNEFDFCGYCMLKNIQSNTPEIGIDLRRKYRRKHIGHEALSKMIDIARELFEIDHFIYAVDVENTASQKLAEELGGVRRETKNTLSEKIVEMLKETQVAQEPELFQHYEYWI